MPTRRKFLTTVTLGGAGIGLVSLDNYPKPLFQENAAGFSLLIFGTNWGFSGTWNDFAARVKQQGYDGVEVWVPGEEKNRNEFLEAMQKHNLKFGFLCGGSDKDPGKHFSQFQEAITMALKLKPVYINCHSGRDFFSFEQNRKFIDFGYQASRGTGVPVYHETHRGRILYSAPVAKTFIESIPDLRLTLDISHWCNVHESLLADQNESVLLALNRADHIHARIGHPEGPQVNDPRAPEWEAVVKAHLGWWDKIVEQKKKEGKQLTILTEFGPADYMPTLPYTRQPLANQWEINAYMMELLRKRYQI